MLTNIKTNLETIEAMLYFWQATSEKENVAESFFYDVANMKGLALCYDEEFTGESIRKVLSAIKNRELLSDANKKEKRFWNYNMWVMEDLEYTNSMVAPVKKLNLDFLVEKLNNKIKDTKYDTVEIFFAPLHMDDCVIKDNCLVLNFFKVKPSDYDDSTLFVGKVLEEYIEEKIIEILTK